MEVMSNQQSVQVIQSVFLESVMGRLSVEPIFFAGIIFVSFIVKTLEKRKHTAFKKRTYVLSAIMYYYIYVMLLHIVGTPTLKDFVWRLEVGEKFFAPNLNLIPFGDGFHFGFLLNVFLFIPLGFLCPLISKMFQRAKNMFLMGFCFSAFIESVQLFTLYRVSDTEDLLANVIGVMAGYGCFKISRRFVKKQDTLKYSTEDTSACVPITVIITACAAVFFS